MNWLLDIGILSGPAVVLTCAAAGLAVALLVAVRPSRRWNRRRWVLTAAVAALVAGLFGIALTWLLADHYDLFGVVLTSDTRMWVALGFAGTGIALASLWRPTWRRAIAAPLAAVLFVVTAAMGVNIAFGQYPTVRTALGLPAFGAADLPAVGDDSDRPTIADWTPPSGMPSHGEVGTVTIPATASGFTARPAVIYRPPAALTDDPPLLPVLIMMSGQPGQPQDPLIAAHLQQSLDAYAAAHDGLAPIVVSPDQLGTPDANPMCIDSPLGNSATYLTVDVPTWISANLPVLDSPEYWGIGGLSQGGTCSIQLGAAHPELFSAILDASGEEFPSLGDEATTVAQGFGGDTAAYEAAKPAAIMAAHAPYEGMTAVFGVGSEDAGFLPGVQRIYQEAQDAGMDATYIEAQGSAHDATSWSYIFEKGLGIIADHWGLNR
ncbi:esterase family protein [Microbacterium sp. cf332]|uniref:alpha/beta hydrolase n=1 Tax=Microbacterium sp. cf332 TaxID=1761804 RepID=UPI00088822E6|nr:alpha/beta hydrolase-fold protein [Microbacterium sp. cf332]SDQ96946.1 Putative esterase [Microbacterium sp. cf332]